MHIHSMVTELLILIESLTTLFTFKFLEVIIQMNSFVVFLFDNLLLTKNNFPLIILYAVLFCSFIIL